MIFILLTLPLLVVAEWDCSYIKGKKYEYNYTSELVNNVPDKVTTPFSLRGLTVNGRVTITPLGGVNQPILIQLYVSNVLEHTLETFYVQDIDRQSFSAIFRPQLEYIELPRYQSSQGSNLLRGIISTFKIKSCTQTGVYTAEEITILGTHVTHYEGTAVNHGMFDERIYMEPDQSSVNNDNLDITRTIVSVQDENVIVGNTAFKHGQFLGSLINRTSTRHYSYMTSALNVVYDCVALETYSPTHVVGYATGSDVTIRTTYRLVSTTLDSEKLYALPTQILYSKIGGLYVLKHLKMDLNVPDLRPDTDFAESSANLKTLLLAGYRRTSTSIMRAWLDIVRHLYIGVPYKSSNRVFASKADETVLPWYIDAVNVNGTAQLHLQIHNAIKVSKAHMLTERFIGTKQFTPNPPHRMIKWLMKTCSIDRYEEVCSLAIASSATNYFICNTGRLNVVYEIFEYLKKQIQHSKTADDRIFFIQSLGNLKLPSVSSFIVELALNSDIADARTAAIGALHMQPSTTVSYEERSKLLERSLKDSSVGGAAALFYVLSTSTVDNVPTFIAKAVLTVCNSPFHPLGSFLHQTLTVLSDTWSDSHRGTVVREKVRYLYNNCDYCLSEGADKPSELVLSSYLFGNPLLGALYKYERFSGTGSRVTSGTTSLELQFLAGFGIPTILVQSSFELSDVATFQKKSSSGELNVIVAGERVKSSRFQFGGTASSDVNLLLIDATQLIPTMSGIPLSYTLTGTTHSETKLSNTESLHFVVDNKIGLYIDGEFKIDGSSAGWITKANFMSHYQDVYDLTSETVERYTVVKDVNCKVDTTGPYEWSNINENALYFKPTSFLNSSLSLKRTESYDKNLLGCQAIPKTPQIVSFGNTAKTFDPKSYLGTWLNSLNIQHSQIFELQQYGCSGQNILSDVNMIDNVQGVYSYIVNIQVLYGIILVNPHKRVHIFGDSSERNLRLKGSLGDVMELLRRSRYYPLDGYSGPEILTISIERSRVNHSITTQSSIVFYVSDVCT